MIGLIIRWVISDLKVDAQLNIEDAELLRLGYSWTEAQSMTIAQRQSSVSAATIVADFHRMSDRRSAIDVAILSSGFAEKTARQSITSRWDKEAEDNLQAIADYNLESVGGLMSRGKAKPKTKNFKAILAGAKHGRTNNRSGRAESDDQSVPDNT